LAVFDRFLALPGQRFFILQKGLIHAARCSLLAHPATNVEPAEKSLAQIKKAMIDKHLGLIRQAAGEGAQIVCLQEIFYGPYFCAEQSTRWYDSTEPVPDGPTIHLMQSLAKELGIALIVPIYEVENEGVYYNTAAVIDRAANTSASIARRISRTSRLAFGRSSTFVPATSAFQSSISAFAKLASTSATTPFS